MRCFEENQRIAAGERLRSPAGLRTDTLRSGQTKIEEDVEIPLPAGTRLTLPAGTVVLAGAWTAAVPVEPGDRVTATFDRIGSVEIEVA